MKKFARWRVEMLSILILLTVAGGLSAIFVNQHLDRSFIAYRYARNLAAGHGLAYNTGQPMLSDDVAPFYVLALAIGARFTADLPLLSNIISMAAIAAGALALYGLVHPVDRYIAAGAAAIYLTFPLVWTTVGLDVALWTAFGLLASWMYVRQWGEGAALLLALATLTRPEAAVLAAVLAVDAVLRGRASNLLPAAIYGGVMALGLLWIGTDVDGRLLPGLPHTFAGITPPDVAGTNIFFGLNTLAQALWAISPLWIAMPILAPAGIPQLYRERSLHILAGWAGLHLVTLAFFQSAVCVWHFIPLAPAIAVMTAAGIRWLVRLVNLKSVRWIVGAACTALMAGAAGMSLYRLVVLPAALPQAWRALMPVPVEQGFTQAGAWLNVNTPPEARVGATRIGVLGYVSDRALLDYYGTLQPEIAHALQRGDSLWWLNEYLPEYVVLRESEIGRIAGSETGIDPWFAATYTEAARFEPAQNTNDAVVILARAATPPPLTEHLVGMVTYPGGVVLNSIATDFSLAPLEGGRTGRIRLEWLLEEPVSTPTYVSISIQGYDGTIAALGGRMVNFQSWPIHRLITTFHTVDLAPAMPPGVYTLSVGIGPDPFSLIWQSVTTAKIPFPDTAFVGALSGIRAEFGDIVLLGYRVSRTPEGKLEVLLLWQAINPLRADYRVFIQVLDEQGAVVAQMEVEPHDGAYPTSIWSAGERVPDSYWLDTGGLPPGEYAVYVGLLDPDGNRLLTLEGRDTVLIGRVTIGEEGP